MARSRQSGSPEPSILLSYCWVCGAEGTPINNGFTCDECEVRWGKAIVTNKLSDSQLIEQGYGPPLDSQPSPG